MPASDLRWSAPADQQTVLFEPSRRVVGRGEYRSLTFWEVESKTLINRVPRSSGLPFEYTINAYRGCSHACRYCFARPTHEYLGFDIGADFDSQIVVKANAVDLVRAETMPGRWAGQPIAMGTNTDPYQKAEGKYRLTRGIAEVLVERRNPFSILTKSTLALRDLDLFGEAARHDLVSVDFSIGTLDEDAWRATEPGTPHPRLRMDAVRRLNEEGIPSGVLVAPLIPHLTDRPDQVEAVMEAARQAGARSTTPIRLHLRPGVKQHWMAWLAEAYPELVVTYEELYEGRAYLGKRRNSNRNRWQPRPAPVSRPDQMSLDL